MIDNLMEQGDKCGKKQDREAKRFYDVVLYIDSKNAFTSMGQYNEAI